MKRRFKLKQKYIVTNRENNKNLIDVFRGDVRVGTYRIEQDEIILYNATKNELWYTEVMEFIVSKARKRK